MTIENVDSARATPSAAPLRMQKPDGGLYERPKEVEDSLACLLQLDMSELMRRACVEDQDDPDYIRTECLLYFVRRLNFGTEETALHVLFNTLRQRVLKAVPVRVRRLTGTGQVAERAVDLEVRDRVLQRFQELLCGDRQEYDTRLDFYECRFNQAVARLRLTARRDVQREESHYQPAAAEDDFSDRPSEPESAFAEFLATIEGENSDPDCRSRLHMAISSLPGNERQVIEMLLKGLPIDSTDSNVVTITKVLGCAEKTVRNRRDRAIAKLRDALMREDEG